MNAKNLRGEIVSKLQNGFADDIEKDETEGEGDADPNAVSFLCVTPSFGLSKGFSAVLRSFTINRGLDNAGKTTILKKFNGEDIDTIEPTLGFNIKTLEHRGCVFQFWALHYCYQKSGRQKFPLGR